MKLSTTVALLISIVLFLNGCAITRPIFFKEVVKKNGKTKHVPRAWWGAPLYYYGLGMSGGSTSVKGHYRKNGTYVSPHHRSKADGTTSNNWSTKGNTNPYTGKAGTRE